MNRVVRTLEPFRWRLLAGLLCLGVLAAAGALHAYLTGPLVQLVLTGGQKGLEYFQLLIPESMLGGDLKLTAVAGVLVLVAAVKGAAHWGQAVLLDGTAERVGHQLRTGLYAHMMALPIAEHRRLAPGDLVARLLSDIALVQQATVNGVISLVRQGLSGACLLVVAGVMAPRLTLMAALVLPLVGVVVWALSRAVKRATARGQDQVGRMGARAARGLGAVREIKSSGAEQREGAAFGQYSAAAMGWAIRRIRTRALSPLINEVTASAALGITLVHGGGRIASGELSPERFISFFVAAVLLYRTVKEAGNALQQLAAGRAGVERVSELEALAAEAPPATGQARPLTNALELQEVGFSYVSGKPALTGISLSLRPGRVTALAGPSGAGKSTLANIVCGLEPAEAGELFWDGEPLDREDHCLLRSRVALVPQQPLLLDESLALNLRLGRPDASSVELERAVEQAGLAGVSAALEQGLETIIGPEGVQLSVGEIQRVALARALLREASVLVLDEPSSALDPQSEENLVHTLRRAAEAGKAVLVIAHREALIEAADEVVRMDGGKLVL